MKPYLIRTHKRFLYCSLEKLVNQCTKETSMISQFILPKIRSLPILQKLDFIVWNDALCWKQWICDFCYCASGNDRHLHYGPVFFFKLFTIFAMLSASVLFWKSFPNVCHFFSAIHSHLYLPAITLVLLGLQYLDFHFFPNTTGLTITFSKAPAIQNSLLVSLLHCFTMYSKPQLKAQFLFLAALISTQTLTYNSVF